MIHVCLIEARKGGHVLKCGRTLPEDYGPNEVADFKAKVIGWFRHCFQEWPDTCVENIHYLKKF